MKLRDLMLDEDFRSRLLSGRGGGEFVIRYRTGDTRSAGGDDAEGGAGIDRLDACLDEMERAVGLPIANSCIFCSEPRTTVTVHFAIPGAACDLVASYDSVKRSFAIQLLHPDQITVEHHSHVDLAHSYVAPDMLVDAHFPAATEAAAVRDTLFRLGCRPRATEGEELSYETYTVDLDVID